MKISEKIKRAPGSCGVYIFKGKDKRPTYIGRSVNLKQRLKSYLNSADPKTRSLIGESVSLTLLPTSNLIEAVIKEADLIKRYEPKYNIKEKDNRSFCYIVIRKEKWSSPRIIRGRLLAKNDLSHRFGPFKSLRTARNILLALRKVFPFSTCSEKKPCFHYSIGLCPGKCTGEITEKDYKKNIKGLSLFLSGRKEEARRLLKKNHPEKAGMLDNMDDSFLISKEEESLKEWQDLRIEGYDISHFSGKETVGAAVLFNKGSFDKSGYRIFKIKDLRPGDDISALKEVLRRRLGHAEWEYPDLILVDGGKAQVNALEKIIAEKKMEIPVLGISKYGGDKAVLGKKSPDYSDREFFRHLREIRDEAHRFANSFRKRAHSKKLAF